MPTIFFSLDTTTAVAVPFIQSINPTKGKFTGKSFSKLGIWAGEVKFKNSCILWLLHLDVW